MTAASRIPPRRGRSLAAALFIAAPAIVMVATPGGRGVMADGFMQLSTIGLPTSLLAALLAAGHFGAAWTRSRPAGAVLALAGTAVAFQGARLISGWWLILGRGLNLESLFLRTTGLAAIAVVGGLFALVEGVYHARGGASGTTATLAGVGIVLVPLLPVFLLTGDGVAVVVFDDLAEPAFSRFPGDTTTLTALLVLLGGLVAALVGGMLPLDAPVARRLAHLAVGAGVLAVAGGYAWHVVRGLSVETGDTGGAIWPGVNVAPVVLALAAGILHLRRARSRRADEPRSSVAFEVDRTDPP